LQEGTRTRLKGELGALKDAARKAQPVAA